MDLFYRSQAYHKTLTVLGQTLYATTLLSTSHEHWIIVRHEFLTCHMS